MEWGWDSLLLDGLELWLLKIIGNKKRSKERFLKDHVKRIRI